MRELYQKSSSWSPNRCSFHLPDFLSFNFWVHRCRFVLIYLSVIEISRLLCWSISWIMVRNLKKGIGYEKIVSERPRCQVCHAYWGIGCTKFQSMKSSYSETGGACVDTIFWHMSIWWSAADEEWADEGHRESYWACGPEWTSMS